MVGTIPETSRGSVNHTPSAERAQRVKLLPKQTIQIIPAKADMERHAAAKQPLIFHIC